MIREAFGLESARLAEVAAGLDDAAYGRPTRCDPVLELAVHGLDLAAALDREPWMTAPAADVTEELLLPGAAAAGLRAAAGWDQVTLIAALTGRRRVTSAQARLIASSGAGRLALG